MKLLITVQGAQYEVDVQILDEGPVPAAGGRGPAPAATAPAQAPARPASTPAPAARPAAAAPGGGAGDVKSPIAGSVLDVKVKPGDVVAVNDPLLVLEAMKMESVVASPQAGTVREVLVKSGEAVAADQVLVRF